MAGGDEVFGLIGCTSLSLCFALLTFFNNNNNIEERTRKNNILDVFVTNNYQLTRQIVITETSISDHNIIQIETTIKIEEERHKKKQIKKSNLSYRELNFFNEDISWASIDLTCSTQAGTCF